MTEQQTSTWCGIHLMRGTARPGGSRRVVRSMATAVGLGAPQAGRPALERTDR